ncbi:unnamed protein product, partial [Ectocarpus sp. 4 AP-2014]
MHIVHRGKSILDISGFGDPASTENVLPIDNCDGRRSSHHPYLDNRSNLSYIFCCRVLPARTCLCCGNEEESSYEYARCVSRYGNACEARYSATDMSAAVGPFGKDRLSCWCLTT